MQRFLLSLLLRLSLPCLHKCLVGNECDVPKEYLHTSFYCTIMLTKAVLIKIALAISQTF